MVDKQYLIDTNEKLLSRWNETHQANSQPIETRPEIDDIIPMVEKYDKKNMNLDDFIKKASYLMAIISWQQPFLDGNKRTGLVSTIKFLRENGYSLDMPREDQKEIGDYYMKFRIKEQV